jgi:hypothetical protein
MNTERTIIPAHAFDRRTDREHAKAVHQTTLLKGLSHGEVVQMDERVVEDYTEWVGYLCSTTKGVEGKDRSENIMPMSAERPYCDIFTPTSKENEIIGSFIFFKGVEGGELAQPNVIFPSSLSALLGLPRGFTQTPLVYRP